MSVVSTVSNMPSPRIAGPKPTDLPTVPMLFKIDAALTRMSAPQTDYELVMAARAFIPLAIAAERATQAFNALDADPAADANLVDDADERMLAAMDAAEVAAIPIMNLPAQSLAGFVAKAVVPFWCCGGEMFDGPRNALQKMDDQTSTFAIVRDLIEVAAPSHEGGNAALAA